MPRSPRWLDSSTFRRAGDQVLEALRPRRLLLRAGDIEDADALIRRRLCGEVAPRLPVRAKLLLHLRRPLERPVFIGVDGGLLLVALLVCAQPGRLHASELDQFRRPLDVDPAPDAALPPRREADGVALVVDALPHAVDPPETQRLVHRLRPRDRRLPRAPFPEPDQQFRLACVVLCEPPAERGRSLEEGGG